VAALGYDACFLSGLAKAPAPPAVGLTAPSAPEAAEPGETAVPPHRPFKIVYASLYADVRPSFIVDISPFIEQRHAALMAYRSQYANQAAGGGLFVPEEEIRERTFAEARHYGLLAGVRYGEPFIQKEVGLVDDLTLIPVQSI
jgi:LmbE family N-acetylglucosaminyl deacetylase